MEKSGQRNQRRRFQLDESLVADQSWKLFTPMLADLLRVVGLEIPEPGMMKQDDNGHHFAGAQARFALAMSFSITQLLGGQLR